jgi:hypothetical protein
MDSYRYTRTHEILGIPDNPSKTPAPSQTVPNGTFLQRTPCHHGAVMPKKKLQKQSDEALLAEVKKEMALPRAAEFTLTKDLDPGDPLVVERTSKEKAMRNRWLAFLIIMVAVIAVLFAHEQWGGAYVERQKNSFFESGAREALQTINTAAVSYSAEHGKFPAKLADLGPQGAKLLDDPLSSGAIMGYTIDYHSSDAGKAYGLMADPRTRFGRNFFTDQTRVLRVGKNGSAPEYK